MGAKMGSNTCRTFRRPPATCAAAQKTPYGLTVSPHYLRESRARRGGSKDGRGEGGLQGGPSTGAEAE